MLVLPGHCYQELGRVKLGRPRREGGHAMALDSAWESMKTKRHPWQITLALMY